MQLFVFFLIFQIAYRLITVPILHNVSLCVLCGAEPLYMEVQALAQQIYAPVLVSLQAVDSCYPRNLPNGLELDESILGVLLINRRTSKCVVSRNVDNNSNTNNGTGEPRQMNGGHHHLDILKTFHNQAVDMMDELLRTERAPKDIKVLESYWSSDYYKLHALVQGDSLLCVMYTAAIPVHTMRLISKDTLNMVLGERELCF